MSLSQKAAASLIRARTPFKTGNVFAVEQRGLYVAYSYGEHFPMAVYDPQDGWFVNMDDYNSPSTRQQQSKTGVRTLPGCKLEPTAALVTRVAKGSVLHRVTERISS